MADETYPDAAPTPPQDNETAKEPYYGAQALAGRSSMSLGDLRYPPVRRIVEEQIKELKAQVDEREKFLADLDKEPTFESLLNRMRKLGI